MRRLALIILLLISASAALAQDATPAAPWPPDPTTIFAEGVQWSVIEDAVEEPEPEETKTVSIEWGAYNTYGVQSRDKATGIVQHYPFPIKGPALKNVSLQDNGQILVTTHASQLDTRLALFLLDPITGHYQRVPIATVCEGRIIQAAPGKGEWIAVDRNELSLAEDEDVFLCQTETGEQRQPAGLTSNASVVKTPDKNRLLIIDVEILNGSIFVYDILNDVTIPLGTPLEGRDNSVSICAWMSDTKGVLCTHDDNRYYVADHYYEFDITRKDSLKSIFFGWPETMVSFTNPIRYFALYDLHYFAYQNGASGNDPVSCFLWIYDANGLRKQTLGSRCIPIMPYPYGLAPFFYFDDTLYYLTTQNDMTPLSTLYRYDLQTETISDPLLTREIESIISVSPNARYIALVLDDNGELDFQWDYGFCCSPSMEMGILDTQTGEIVYRSEKMGIYMASQVVWVDNSTLIVAVSEGHELDQTLDEDRVSYTMMPGSTRRIHLSEASATSIVTTEYACEYSIEGSPSDLVSTLSPDGHFCIADERYLLNTETLEAVPILKPLDEQPYRISLRWTRDGHLKANVSLSYDQSITYLITLPTPSAGGAQ